MIKIALMGTRADGTPDLNTRHWIAGDPLKNNADHSALDVDQRAITRQSQDDTGALWDFRIPNDRGNEKLTMGFTTTLSFSSLIAAWRWRNSFSSLTPSNWPHPLRSDAIMRFENTDGTFEDVRMYNVLLSKPTMKGLGVAIECSYQLTGGRIEEMTTGESAIPMSDSYAHDAPMAGLFLTSVGGDPVLGDAQTWSSGTESSNGWRLYIQATDIRSTPNFVGYNFYFGLPGGSMIGGAIDFAVPMKDRLADIAAALDPTWIEATIVTEGGRSMLKLRNIRATEFVGSGAPPILTVEIWEYWPRTPAQILTNTSTGVLTLFSDVIPYDDAGDIPVADDDVG
jgi:hypothetical protein